MMTPAAIRRKMKKIQRKEIRALGKVDDLKDKLHAWEQHAEELNDDYNVLNEELKALLKEKKKE